MKMNLDLENVFFRYTIGICVLAMLFAAGMYAYLGSFSRYSGDDYCEAARIARSSPLGAVFERYFDEDWPRATMRYSNLFFVGLSESLGRYNMQITIPAMVMLWFVGCVWSVHEFRKLLGVRWDFVVDLFLGLTFGFFSLKQAPNLFETVYWRSAMMTHFAPLVFGLLLFAFLVRQARHAERKSPSLLLYFFIILATFIIAGFSEPPTTTLLTVVPLLMAAVWLWETSPAKRNHLALLGCVFVGALLALFAMLLSPASADAAQQKTFDIVEILGKSFLYSYLFLKDSLRSQPLPIILSLLTTFMLVWLYCQFRAVRVSAEQQRWLGILIISLPLLAWLLIAAGFSPSVYGQSFPVERMRFLASSILVATCMLEGALFGLLLGQNRSLPSPLPGQVLVLVAFVVVAIGYPLRTALNLVRIDLPEYQARAESWDARDAYIRSMKDQGNLDLTVPFLSTEIIQDLGDRSEFRLNRCASVLYGINSIVARPLKK